MKSLQYLFIFFVISFCLTASIAVRAQDETMTNQEVISLTKAGLNKSIIVNKIRTSKSGFDLSTDALIELKKAGVDDDVVAAMLQAKTGKIAISSGTATNVTIPDGTEIKIMTTEDISGQKVVEGDPLTFKIAEDVKINDAIVIVKDTIVKGTVSNAKKKGMLGKSGELSVRIESTQTIDGQKLKLRASKSGEGGDNMGSTVALTVLFGPLGLLKHGKEAKIKTGTILSAYTDEVKTVTFTK